MSYFIMLKALSLTLSLKHSLVVLITVQNFKDTYLRHCTRWNNLIISVYRAFQFLASFFFFRPSAWDFLSGFFLLFQLHMDVCWIIKRQLLHYCKQCHRLIAVINRCMAAACSDAPLRIRQHFINPNYRTAESVYCSCQGSIARTNYYLMLLDFL